MVWPEPPLDSSLRCTANGWPQACALRGVGCASMLCLWTISMGPAVEVRQASATCASTPPFGQHRCRCQAYNLHTRAFSPSELLLTFLFFDTRFLRSIHLSTNSVCHTLPPPAATRPRSLRSLDCCSSINSSISARGTDHLYKKDFQPSAKLTRLSCFPISADKDAHNCLVHLGILPLSARR